MIYERLETIVSKELRRNSKRRTPERFIVLDSLVNVKDGFSAEDVYNNLSIDANICIATIYNTLSYFKEMGIIERIPSLDNKIRYRLTDEAKNIILNSNKISE